MMMMMMMMMMILEESVSHAFDMGGGFFTF